MPLLFCGSSFSSSVKTGRGGNGPESARLSDVSSCCQAHQHAQHLEKSPVKFNTGLIMLIMWNKAQSPLPPVASSRGEKTPGGLMGLSIRLAYQFTHIYSIHDVIFLLLFCLNPHA